jgi:hypothetical protein
VSFFEPFMCPVQQLIGVVGAAHPPVVPTAPSPISTAGLTFKKQKPKRAWLPYAKRYLEMKLSFAQFWRGEIKT